MDKIRLRNTLRKLKSVPFDQSEMSNVAMAPQEMLDFLAMLAGIKPVYMLGCGFEDPQWVASVAALAESMGLRSISGPVWKVVSGDSGKIKGIVGPSDAKNEEAGSAIYICKSRDTATEVSRLCSLQSVTVEDEATLLGYPACCVRDWYRKIELMDETFYKMLLRASNGDESEMRRLILEDVGIEPETQEEKAAFAEVHEGQFGPFTSISMCKSCIAEANSPARRISRSYETLADAIGADFKQELAHYHS